MNLGPDAGRILLVDDDPDFRGILERQLGGQGHVLMSAATGDAALMLLERTRPDLVLLDYRLPGLNGLEICRRIRSNPVHEFLPVILLTEHASMEVVEAAVAVGVNDFLDKAAPLQVLLLRIRAALRTRRLADLAARRFDEVRYLADLSARLGGTLREEDLFAATAEALARFAPTAFYVLELGAREPMTLRSYAARPLRPRSPRLERLLSRAGADLGRRIDPEPVELVHHPTAWPEEPEGHLLSAPLGAGESPRMWLAVTVTRRLGEDDLRLLDAVRDRLALPLENAHLYRSLEEAHTQVKEMVKESRRTQKTLVHQEKMASIGQLAAGVAHEINNPLAFVISNLNVLREYARDLTYMLRQSRAVAPLPTTEGGIDADFLVSDLDSLIAESLEGANRVHRIIRDLKSFSHTSEGGYFEEVDVQSAVESTLNILHGEVKNRAVVIRELRPVPAVRGDRGKLNQVFLNLVMNAVHAIPRERDGRIVVRLFQSGSNVAVQVEDNGTGIPETVRGRIFEPFFTTKEIGVGSGLGLPIADDIVRQHGGRILFESEVGRGSVFTVLLPARNTIPLPSVSVEPPPPDEPSGVAVFIDDERYLLNAFQRAFGRKVKVLLAQGGDEGLEILAATPAIDVVFCDLLMPDRSGIEVYDWVRIHRPDLADRFVIITGGHLDRTTRDFVERTELPVVHKPFSVTEVEQIISRHVRRPRKKPPWA